MIAALVRESERKLWVGVYAAPTIERLRELVDETYHEPSECEYASLPDFGLLVNTMGAAPKLPLEDDQGDIETDADHDETDWIDDDLGLPIEPLHGLRRSLSKSDLVWQPLDPSYEHYEAKLRSQLSTHEGRLKLLKYFRFMEAKDDTFPKHAENFCDLVEAIKENPNATAIVHEYFNL